MEITRIKNVKDFPIVEQSEISEVLAYDAEGNLIRAKYDEPEIDIDLSDYYNKSETDDIVDKLEKDIADASAALLGSQSNPYYETIRGAVAIGQAAQAAADVNSEDIRKLNEWADTAQTTIDAAWATAKDSNEKATAAQTTANNAQTTANDAQNSAWAAQAAAETADAKADANAADIDVLETTVDYHSESIRTINATIGDINNILSNL